MSCNGNYKCFSSAASRNGVSSWLSRSMSVVGSWGTINAAIEGMGGVTLDPKNIAGSAPQTAGTLGGAVAKMATNAALDTVGLSLTNDTQLQMRNAKGLLIASHALEQATGSVATLGARQLVRGKPYMKYQGVLVRKNPLIKKMTAAVPRLTKGRVTPQPEDAYYFHRDGITWSCTTTGFNVLKDTPKKMAVLKSFGFPGRSYYFDRRPDERDAIDLVGGDRDPETIPGFLGNTTEIDSVLSPLRRSKKALMGLNWLTVDDSERDVRRGQIVDYDKVFSSQKTRSGLIDYRRLASAHRATSYRDLVMQPWEAAGQRGTKKKTSASMQIANTIKYKELVDEVGEDLLPPKIKIPGQKEACPLRVDALDEMRDGTVLADAYYRAPDGEWFPITDERVSANLGRLALDTFEKKSRAQYL